MTTMKTIVLVLGLGIMLAAVSCNNKPAENQPPPQKEIKTPDEALDALKEGNKHFVADSLWYTDYEAQRERTQRGQHPHAVILSCLDSRVPPEIIFDQGIGNIFVTRVAGNIEDSDVLGSMEYATYTKGSKLVVVMGHSHCGAIEGAIDNYQLGNLTQLLAHIRPAIKGDTSNREAMIDSTIRNNVRLTISHILARSPVINKLVNDKKVKIVGAYYDFATGEVEFTE